MKKYAALILALAVICTVLCGCDVKDGIISDRNGTLTDNNSTVSPAPMPSSNVGDKNNGNGSGNGNAMPVDPKATAIPGTSVITP